MKNPNYFFSFFTLGMIAATGIISIYSFSRIFVYDKLSFSVTDIRRNHQYRRFITSLFVHADWSHLIFNIFSFFFFSSILEITIGTPTTAMIYFVSGIFGNFIALVLNKYDYTYRAVGASGAIAGVIFASIFLLPEGNIFIFPVPFRIPSWIYAFIYILATLYGVGLKSSDIGHEAHLGGALAGILSALILKPDIIFTHTFLLLGTTIPVIFFFLHLRVTHR